MAEPSQYLDIFSSTTGLPALSDSVIAGAPSGSNPMHFVSGDIYFNTNETPADKPPPPTGIKQKSKSPSKSFIISCAIVPAPSIILSSSNEWKYFC